MSLEYTPNQEKGINKHNKLHANDIRLFQSLYAKHFKQTLAINDARAELTALVRLMELSYQPISIRQFDGLIHKGIDVGRN